jgi:hypothetical protein
MLSVAGGRGASGRPVAPPGRSVRTLAGTSDPMLYLIDEHSAISFSERNNPKELEKSSIRGMGFDPCKTVDSLWPSIVQSSHVDDSPGSVMPLTGSHEKKKEFTP